jgi:hypothetical protein
MKYWAHTKKEEKEILSIKEEQFFVDRTLN